MWLCMSHHAKVLYDTCVTNRNGKDQRPPPLDPPPRTKCALSSGGASALRVWPSEFGECGEGPARALETKSASAIDSIYKRFRCHSKFKKWFFGRNFSPDALNSLKLQQWKRLEDADAGRHRKVGRSGLVWELRPKA